MFEINGQINLYDRDDNKIVISQKDIREVELWINNYYTGLIPVNNKGVLSIRNVNNYQLVKSAGKDYNLVVNLNPEDFI